MNDVVRFPPQLRVVSNPLEDALARGKPRYVALHRARQRLIETWRQLISSAEMTDAELFDEARLTGSVLAQLLSLHRMDHPAQPDEAPPGAA